MAWIKGFAFRATPDYVVDGANDTYVQADNLYPTTRNSVTFGWDSSTGLDDRDRTTSGDVRLAGMNFLFNDGTQRVFRVDLVATGDFKIRLALGDAFSTGYVRTDFFDNTSSLGSVIDSNGVAGNEFVDATGTTYTRAAWPGSNTQVTFTYASTVANFKIGSTSDLADYTPIAYIEIEQVEAAGTWPGWVSSSRGWF